MLKENVDKLTLIQLGVTLATKDGKYPTGASSWQFNFLFDLEYDFCRITIVRKDYCAPSAVQLLKTAGIDFDQFKSRGIDPDLFAEHLFTSGKNK